MHGLKRGEFSINHADQYANAIRQIIKNGSVVSDHTALMVDTAEKNNADSNTVVKYNEVYKSLLNMEGIK